MSDLGDGEGEKIVFTSWSAGRYRTTLTQDVHKKRGKLSLLHIVPIPHPLFSWRTTFEFQTARPNTVCLFCHYMRLTFSGFC